MEYGTLIILVITFSGVMAQTPCSVPCSRPNGFNPNLLNTTVLCPIALRHNIFHSNLVKDVLQDIKNLAHQAKHKLMKRLKENDLSDIEEIHFPDAHGLVNSNNRTFIQTKLQEHMLVYNVFIERVQWTQQCLFKLNGQVNTISPQSNLIRSSVLTLVCVSWDGHQKSTDNIDITYLDRRHQHLENRLAYLCMKKLHSYVTAILEKINSLQS